MGFSSIKLRKWAFTLHRYVGLIVGLLLVMTSLTGSALVFEKEIDAILVTQRFGRIVAPADRSPKVASIESILDRVNANFQERPKLSVSTISISQQPDRPHIVTLQSKAKKSTQVFVNPYSAEIMGTRDRDSAWNNLLLNFHRKLLADRTGETIVGIFALFLVMLCVTGILLWQGWRNFWRGFNISWKAKSMRLNLDIHNVVGITAAAFLTAIAFTGFCWNFDDLTKPIIYAATFTPEPSKPRSTIIADRSSASLMTLIERADRVFPHAVTTFIAFPQKSTDVIRISKKQPGESSERGNTRIWLDRYSGKVLQVQDGLNLSRAAAIFSSFAPMHYGTFGGVLTRIFYVFVGLAPVVLSITGMRMFKIRQSRISNVSIDRVDLS